MIENVKNLRAELHVEGFGDPFDVVVLENRKVHTRDSRTDQDVAAGIATKIEALQVCNTVSALTIVRGPEGGVGRSGDCEALCLDVVVWVPGVSQRRASGPAEPIRESPVIVVL